jgi:S-sulfosulfanyl-L-cysteine sulfohydrolase
MITRRDFITAAAAVSAALGGVPLARAAARQSLIGEALLAHEAFGNLTILHVTDIHAQTKPGYFREPAINIGTGEARGLPPHLTQNAFLSYFGIAAGSPEAYAFTSSDFESLARTYGKLGGLDRIATIVKAVRGERGEGNVLFLDGGDSWQGSWVSLQTGGQDMIDLMSLLKPDAMTGHWEFTYGAERVKEAAGALPFPFLAQNIRSAEWQEPVFEAKRIFERGGAKIAVIGQAFPYTPIANPRWMMPDWEFGIREDDLQKHVNEARAGGADLVALLSHNGFETDRKLASRVRGIDIILSGHTHDAIPQAIKVGSTILAASGCNGKFVSRLDLEISNKRLNGFRYKLIPVFADAIRSDPEMAAAIARSRAPFEKELGDAIGQTEALLYRRGSFNGSLDDLICDAMIAERDCEIAMSPGMRWGTSILPGATITFEDIANATAITYPACYRTEMLGARLKDIVEDVADNIFNPDPYYQQGGDMVRLGGVAYKIDVSAPAGKRISNMTLLRTGEPIEAAKSYKVSGWASINKDVEGPPIWDVLRSYIGHTKTVRLKHNSAITVSGA